jgi:hypothetical protein
MSSTMPTGGSMQSGISNGHLIFFVHLALNDFILHLFSIKGLRYSSLRGYEVSTVSYDSCIQRDPCRRVLIQFFPVCFSPTSRKHQLIQCHSEILELFSKGFAWRRLNREIGLLSNPGFEIRRSQDTPFNRLSYRL